MQKTAQGRINTGLIVASVLSLVFVVADRFAKLYFITHPGSYRDVFVDLVALRFARNHGVAFSISLPTEIILLFSVLAMIALLWFMTTVAGRGRMWQAFGFWSIFLGAASNFLDRARYGFVIDYIDVKFFTVLNIADILISVGVILVVLTELPAKKGSAGKVEKNHELV